MDEIRELQRKLHEAEQKLAMKEGHAETVNSAPRRSSITQPPLLRNPERQPTTPLRNTRRYSPPSSSHYSPPSAQPYAPSPSQYSPPSAQLQISPSPGVEESEVSDCEFLGFRGGNLSIDPSTNPTTLDNSSKDSRPQTDEFKDEPLHPDDIPMEPIPYVGDTERETRRAPIHIVRRNLTPEEIARDVSHEPPFNIPADWPRDRYERPIFYAEKGSQWTFKLWTGLTASEKLAFCMGCPPPRNRIEIIGRRKIVTSLLLELTHSSLDFPMKHYEENNLIECHFRPMAQMIYPSLQILWGWNKQLTIDVMSSIANDNYHNNQQSKRKYANSPANTKTLVRAPAPAPSPVGKQLSTRQPATKPPVKRVAVSQQVPKGRKGVVRYAYMVIRGTDV